MQKSLGALALSIIALAGSPAYASTANGVLTVQATVLAACSVNSGTLAFGVINPATGTGTLTNTNVNVTCSQGTSFAVGLSDGINASGSQRRMKGANQLQYISYELYQDNAGSQRFGDSVTAQRLSGQTGLGLTANAITVYGAVSAGQSAPPDTYSDTVPITVYY